jgi:hypothetical protein
VVPVVHMPFGAIEPLFAGLGPTSLGWLLADHAERLPGWQARSILGRLDRAVLAGDTAGGGETALDDGRGARSGDGDAGDNRSTADDSVVSTDGDIDADGVVNDRRALAESGAFNGAEDVNGASAQRIAERTSRYGTWLPASPPGSAESDESAETADDDAVRVWVGAPLRVVRGLDRATIDLRNNLAYDGLLVSDRDLALRSNAGRAPGGARPPGLPRPRRSHRRPRPRRRHPARS